MSTQQMQSAMRQQQQALAVRQRALAKMAANQAKTEVGSDTDTDDEGRLIREAVQLQQKRAPPPPPPPQPPPPQRPSRAAPVPPAPTPAEVQGTQPAPAPPPTLSSRAHKAAPGSRRAAGHISMKTLVDAGILKPGPGTLCVDYKGTSTLAELTAEGRIQYNGLLFDSPSAFSIYIKRLQNPTRKADDGWKSVKHGGKLLETYKAEYTERQQAQ